MSKDVRQIIAMGTGEFSDEARDVAINRYIVEQAEADRPRIAYLAQAGGEDPQYVLAFYRAFVALGCEPSHLSLFQPHTADLAGYLLHQDIIYVGGGNTKSMLALWREWGVDEILRRAWEAGVVLAGPSAGAICWFEQGSTDSIPGRLSALPCLGFLPGSCCPHYDSDPERRPSFQRMIADGEMASGYAMDDYAALHFVGAELTRVVASVEGAAAYRVEPDRNGGVAETQLEPVYLTLKS